MTTLTFIHHLNYKYTTQHRRFLRCFFFTLLLIFSSTSFATETIKIAVLDTGFCPNLLPQVKNVDIEPVLDFSQSNDYSCSKEQLNHFRFHGHWILENILKNIKPKNKLQIYPMIVFNKLGDQKLSYWQLAMDKIKKENVTLVLMAVGLPVSSNQLKDLTNSYKENQSYILMASGQSDVRLKKENLTLFPQHAKKELLALMFGEYHAPLAKSEKALLPPAQLFSDQIDFFYAKIPEGHSLLKDSSLSVSKALISAITYCEDSIPSFIQLEKCLKDNSSVIFALTNQNKVIKIKGL